MYKGLGHTDHVKRWKVKVSAVKNLVNTISQQETLLLQRNRATHYASVIFVNENENGEKRENNEFVNEN